MIVDGVGGSVGVGVGWVSYERDDDMMDGRVSDHAMSPCVMRWLILSLFFISGMKITRVLLFPICFSVSRYRICMAAFEFSSSAARRISFAASTSACADMILLSASLFSLAALDSESWRSLLSWISLMKISSICLPISLHRLPTPPRTGRLVSRCHLRFPVSSPANLAR